MLEKPKKERARGSSWNDAGDGRSISRGEFLAAGAAWAAGVAAGGATAVGASAVQACAAACPSSEFEWGIPAGVLNVLWTDVLPRLVAEAWQGGAPKIWVGMGTDDLKQAVKAFRSKVDDPAYGATDVLKRRVGKVDDYFNPMLSFGEHEVSLPIQRRRQHAPIPPPDPHDSVHGPRGGGVRFPAQ